MNKSEEEAVRNRVRDLLRDGNRDGKLDTWIASRVSGEEAAEVADPPVLTFQEKRDFFESNAKAVSSKASSPQKQNERGRKDQTNWRKDVLDYSRFDKIGDSDSDASV